MESNLPDFFHCLSLSFPPSSLPLPLQLFPLSSVLSVLRVAQQLRAGRPRRMDGGGRQAGRQSTAAAALADSVTAVSKSIEMIYNSFRVVSNYGHLWDACSSLKPRVKAKIVQPVGNDLVSPCTVPPLPTIQCNNHPRARLLAFSVTRSLAPPPFLLSKRTASTITICFNKFAIFFWMGMKLQHHPACRNKLHEAIRDRVTVPFDGSFTTLNFFQKLLNTASTNHLQVYF